jgi:hypothetical protein
MKKILTLLLLSVAAFQISCTEPYALQTDTFDNALVIEATLTDEFKFQEIKLSRTYRLEEDGPDPEVGAAVHITDSNGNHYSFTAVDGVYRSQQQFKALPDVTYQLHVTTNDGKTYVSTNEKLSSLTSMDDLVAERGVNSKNEEGVKILAKSTKTTTGNEYYRFEYKETHKIIAPHWISKRGVVVPLVPVPEEHPLDTLYMEPWPYEAKICYSTENSKEIAISNTSLNTTNSNVDLIRFLNVTDYKIANRYSINVTMYNENLAAYNYYDALKKSSTQGSLLSQNQPGFYSGNIKNQSNPSEKIIGFFDVAHVSTKRIFFNFEDIFQDRAKPEYPYYCPEITFLNEHEFKYLYCFCIGSPECPSNPPCGGFYIHASVLNREKAVYAFLGEYVYLTNIQCGDCTSFSSNIKPTFWID